MGFGVRVPSHRERTLAVFPALLRSVSDVRRTGSAAYDMCCVAAGRADAYLELGINLYDYGAGYVILTEAGGRFTGWLEGEDGLASGNPLASNGVIHEQVRALISG
jgi:myo-inositol-1(or 4)-monophosphatase